MFEEYELLIDIYGVDGSPSFLNELEGDLKNSLGARLRLRADMIQVFFHPLLNANGRIRVSLVCGTSQVCQALDRIKDVVHKTINRKNNGSKVFFS
ncbi:MAG: hypothetical protein ACD_63C00138G0005 [uncultured bacterium]|nr:MAG: hypothetical protein ACD_63C00138G0005 [uncultured bacterium]